LKTLILDNYDSFTYNLFQLVAEVNQCEPIVLRNDAITWRELQALQFDNLIVSPGPGHPRNPRDFGVCADAVRFAEQPLLGICLGHQGLALAEGAAVVHAPEPMHGRLSAVFHDDSALFRGVPQGFEVVRYHSLIVEEPLPVRLRKTAWTNDGLIMGLQHQTRARWGVQFHPESICTEFGRQLLENFRDLSRKEQLAPSRVWTGASLPLLRERGHLRAFVRSAALPCQPEDVFVQLFGEQPHAFWLDSSRAELGMARFSIMGDASGPHAQVLHYDSEQCRLQIDSAAGQVVRQQSIFAYLEQQTQGVLAEQPELPFDFCGGFVGYLGYELMRECGAADGYESPLPDAYGVLADRALIYDHQDLRWYALCLDDDALRAEAWCVAMLERLAALLALPALQLPELPAQVPLRLARSREQYIEDILAAQELIRDGESYEVCLCNQIQIAASFDALYCYRVLRRRNPAPYAAFLRMGDAAVLCSSPERFLRIDRAGMVETKPIKGTLPRGADAEQDAALIAQLRASAKDQSEHLMIVDLLRNDLGTVCQVASVHVPALMQIESYQTVHQMVSTIRGQLRTGKHVLDCVRAAFPGGSMTGAPKLRTLEIITSLETQARGVYSGTLGYLSYNGSADLNIVIRTIVAQADSATIGVGGAIVALSDPAGEFDETMLKARALLETLGLVLAG
jgi:para-aminobenzoate synthetase